MPSSPKIHKRRDSNDSERQLIDLETLSSSRENSEATSPSPDGTEVSTEQSSLPELSSPEQEEAPSLPEFSTAEEQTGPLEDEAPQLVPEEVPSPTSLDYDPITCPLPPSYQEAVRGWKLTYVDFGPRCISVGGILTKPRFEKFDALVCRANRWLKRNSDLRLRSIETLELSASALKEGASVDTHHVVRRFNAQDRYHFRVLRLWLVPRADGDAHDIQQVGYLNIMPACISPGGVTKKPTFDSLATTIDKYNKLMDNRPLPGIVLAVETLKVKYCEWRELPDPDSCIWSEHHHFRTSFLQMIRIYYISGPPTKEVVGWKDFDPKPIRDTGSLPSAMLPGPRFEGAETLLARGRNWLISDDSIRLTNIQTLDNKLRKGRFKAQKDVLISETPMFTTWYVHSLRFYYVRESKPPRFPNHDLYAHMTVKSFFPRQEAVVSFISQPEEETMTATMNNASHWLESYPGTWIVGVETLEAQCSGRRSNLRQSHSNFIMYGVRLYSTKMFPEQSNTQGVQMDEDDFSDSDWESILNAKPDDDDELQMQESLDTLGATPIIYSRQTTSDGSASNRISIGSFVHFADEPVVFE